MYIILVYEIIIIIISAYNKGMFKINRTDKNETKRNQSLRTDRMSTRATKTSKKQ